MRKIIILTLLIVMSMTMLVSAATTCKKETKDIKKQVIVEKYIRDGEYRLKVKNSGLFGGVPKHYTTSQKIYNSVRIGNIYDFDTETTTIYVDGVYFTANFEIVGHKKVR